MFSSWVKGSLDQMKAIEGVSGSLKQLYKEKLLPLETQYKFHEFHSPALDDGYFEAKPMVMLVGQYSTGKTSFIRYLLGQDYSGIRVGPEPTTDRFIAVMYDKTEGNVPGNALVVDSSKQFRALTKYGNTFLNRFQSSNIDNEVLKTLTFIDSPGILSGEKQRTDRGYDFVGVLEWFAEHTDRIILLFDAHKLDIPDEFKRFIQALSASFQVIKKKFALFSTKLTSAIYHQQLVRIYGALMWSLGKIVAKILIVMNFPVVRVYTGSFWDQPLQSDHNRELFIHEQSDLFGDLQSLPKNSALRKLNDLIKRARLAKIHAYIIAALRDRMPIMIGKEKKKQELIQKLDSVFCELQRKHDISAGDFPDVDRMRESLQKTDFSKFTSLRPSLLAGVDQLLSMDIAQLMSQISLYDH